MLSKSKGQILRVAAVLHILLQLEDSSEPLIIKDEISQTSSTAAIDFVSTSIQHTAYIAGRKLISTEVELAETGMLHLF